MTRNRPGVSLFLFAWLGVMLLAAPSVAQDNARAKKIEAAWLDWMDSTGVKTGALAVTHRGQIVHTAALGADLDQPFEMASLSKAITAVCLQSFVNEGKITHDITLETLLGDRYPTLGGDLKTVTLAELLTHTSGIGPDETQKTMPAWLGTSAPRHSAVTAQVVAREAQNGDRGRFAYNNENYAILGEVIAQVSGQPYRETCRSRVLPRADYPTAEPSPHAGAFDAWGGWYMSVSDYARFHSRHFGPNSTFGTDPRIFPNADAGYGSHYGPGMVWRDFQDRYNFWHFGALCFETLSTGSFTVSWKGEWGAVVAYSACLDFEKMIELDKGLSRAAFAPL